MRKFFTPALEGHALDLAQGNLSLEEEQVMLDEAAADQAEATQDLAEAERIIEVSDALEDLAVVADSVEEATPAEAALVEIAGDMAVAGTDVAPEEVVPAMEGYVGRRIATEGIRETAAAIWKSIQDFLKKIWEKIKNFFYKLFGTIPALRRRLKALSKRAEEASGKSLGDTKKVKLTSGLSSLSIAGKVPKNSSELNKGIKSLGDAVGYVFGTMMGKVAEKGEKIATIISDFDPAKAEASVVEMNKALEGASGSIPGASGSNTTRFPGFSTQIGESLFGDVSLAYKGYIDGKDAGTPLGALDRIRRGGTDLISTSEKTPNLPSEVEFAPLSPAEVDAIVSDLEKILDKMEDYQRGAKSKAVEKAKSDIEKASAKATKAFDSLDKSEDAGEKAAVPYYRGLLNMNAAYARWAQSPAMPLSSRALTSIKAVMTVCEKSLALYTK